MRSRQTSRINNQFWIAGGVFVLCVLSWRFFPAPGQWIGDVALRPLLFGESALNRFAGRPDPELKPEDATELLHLRAENDTLRALLGDEEEARIAAGVIGRPTALPYDVLMLDKGRSDGIMENAPVYVTKNTVIGFVTAVYERSSLVALTSTPGFTSTVYIHGPNIYTTAVGIGGGVTRVHVPQGIPLSEGDLIIIPSLSKGVYGTVSAVDSVPELPEQYGYVTSDLPINSLRAVAVGRRALSVVDFEAARKAVEDAKRDFLLVDVPEGFLIDIEHATSTESATSSETTDESAEPIE